MEGGDASCLTFIPKLRVHPLRLLGFSQTGIHATKRLNETLEEKEERIAAARIKMWDKSSFLFSRFLNKLTGVFTEKILKTWQSEARRSPFATFQHGI